MASYIKYSDKVALVEELINRIQFIKSSMSNKELLNYIIKKLNEYELSLGTFKEASEWYAARISKGMYIGPLTRASHNLYTIYKELECLIKQQS